MGFGVLVKVVGTIANVLEGTVTCEIVLTNRCGDGNVDIANVLEGTVTCEIVLTDRCGDDNVDVWLMCNGKGMGSYTTMDWGPWCNCLVENHLTPIR